MPFTVPTFNLTCNLYTGAVFTNPPRASPLCNLALGKRGNVASTGGTLSEGTPILNIQLLLPALTDIRGRHSAGGGDGVEVPAGSGRHYFVQLVDDAGKGFSNEHRVALLLQTGTWPTPIP